MIESLEFPLAIAAHDAGAANHIIAWLKNLPNDQVNQIDACVAGPALSLWLKAFPDSKISTILDSLSDAKLLISGTGWQSSLEHEARKLARNLGIKSVAVIDHWTNYCDRFIRDGEKVLPDEIWVTDADAQKIAEITFPNLKIVQLPNLYLDRLVQEVSAQNRDVGKQYDHNLLYVLEPIRQAWNTSEQLGEFQALDFFVKNLACLQLGDKLSIRIRPHPSDPIGKYDQWLQSQKSPRISLDNSLSLAEAIAWSDVVVGCQTYAMVVAIALGKPVISSIPPWAPPCMLPQTEIIRLANLVN
jgi:hypothetical protein